MRSTKQIPKVISIAHRIVREADVSDFACAVPRIGDRVVGRGKQDSACTGGGGSAVFVHVALFVGEVVRVSDQHDCVDGSALGTCWGQGLEDFVGYCCAWDGVSFVIDAG